MCVSPLLVFTEAGHVVNTCFELLPFPPFFLAHKWQSVPFFHYWSPLPSPITRFCNRHLNRLFIHSIVYVEKHGLTDFKVFSSIKSSSGFYTLFCGLFGTDHLWKQQFTGVGTPGFVLPLCHQPGNGLTCVTVLSGLSFLTCHIEVWNDAITY